MWNMAETQLRYITDDHARHHAAAEGERLARETKRRWRPGRRAPSTVRRFSPTKPAIGGTPVSQSTPGV